MGWDVRQHSGQQEGSCTRWMEAGILPHTYETQYLWGNMGGKVSGADVCVCAHSISLCGQHNTCSAYWGKTSSLKMPPEPTRHRHPSGIWWIWQRYLSFSQKLALVMIWILCYWNLKTGNTLVVGTSIFSLPIKELLPRWEVCSTRFHWSVVWYFICWWEASLTWTKLQSCTPKRSWLESDVCSLQWIPSERYGTILWSRYGSNKANETLWLSSSVTR